MADQTRRHADDSRIGPPLQALVLIDTLAGWLSEYEY